MNEARSVDMSQEIPPKAPSPDVDWERYIDRPFDLVARVEAARDLAQREMETFGQVSEYEIRKIYGQKTEFTYDTGDQERTEVPPPPVEARERSPLRENRKQAEANRSQASLDFSAREPAPHKKPVKEA
jgi:hypothetical protein